MANLIITIIAIALVAVMAIAGIWYGSTAFTEAQAKAEANKILSNFKQVDGAIKVFAVENSGSLPDCASDWPVSCVSPHTFSNTEMASFLEPRYIEQGFFQSSPVRGYRNANLQENGLLVVYGPAFAGLTEQVCRHLEGLRTGSPPSINRVYGTAPSVGFNKVLCGQYGCFADNVTDAWGSADFIAYFRLAGPPVPASPDCTINP